MRIAALGFQDWLSNFALKIEQINSKPWNVELVSVRPASGRGKLRSGVDERLVDVVDGDDFVDGVAHAAV